MKIITISGLDGSGKSTQVEMLRKHLEGQGRKVFYFHAIQSGIAKKINDFRLKYCVVCRYLDSCKRTKGAESAAPRTELSSGAGVTEANFLQIILRRIFLMIDILRFKKLLDKLRNSGYDYMLSDRYFYDSAINIRYLAKKDAPLPCEKFIPRPDHAFYLDTDPEKIMRRKRKPDQGLEYLQKKKGLYDKYTSVWNLRTVDGNRTKEEIFEEMKKYV